MVEKKELIFESGTDWRKLHLTDARSNSRSLHPSLNEWDIIEVPREAVEDRPFRMIIFDDQAIEHVADVIMAIDRDAKYSGRSHLKLTNGILKRINYKEAVEFGLVAGMRVVKLD